METCARGMETHADLCYLGTQVKRLDIVASLQLIQEQNRISERLNKTGTNQMNGLLGSEAACASWGINLHQG